MTTPMIMQKLSPFAAAAAWLRVASSERPAAGVVLVVVPQVELGFVAGFGAALAYCCGLSSVSLMTSLYVGSAKDWEGRKGECVCGVDPDAVGGAQAAGVILSKQSIA